MAFKIMAFKISKINKIIDFINQCIASNGRATEEPKEELIFIACQLLIFIDRVYEIDVIFMSVALNSC